MGRKAELDDSKLQHMIMAKAAHLAHPSERSEMLDRERRDGTKTRYRYKKNSNRGKGIREGRREQRHGDTNERNKQADRPSRPSRRMTNDI